MGRASVSIDLGPPRKPRIKWGLADSSGERLVLRSRPPTGCLLPSLAALVAVVYFGWTTPRPGALLGLSVVLSLPVFGRRFRVFDRRARVLEDGGGVFWPAWKRRTSLEGIDVVVVEERLVVRQGEDSTSTTTTYAVSLRGGASPLLVGTAGVWEAAIELAEALAHHLELSLDDRHQQQFRRFEDLDTPLRDWRRPLSPAARSAASSKQATAKDFAVLSDQGGVLRIHVPQPRQHALLVLAALILLFWAIPVSLLGSVSFGLFPLAIILATWVKTAFGYAADVQVSPAGLEVEIRGLVIRRRCVIAASELEDLVLQRPEQGGPREMLAWVFSGFLIARSDRVSIRFGYGLSDERLRALRDLLMERISAGPLAGRTERVGRVPYQIPTLSRPHFPLAGLATGVLLGVFFDGPLTACLAVPFWEHVLSAWGLLGLAAGLALEPARSARRRRVARAFILGALILAFLLLTGWFPLSSAVPLFDERTLLFRPASRDDRLVLAGLLPMGVAAAAVAWIPVVALVRMRPALGWLLRRIAAALSAVAREVRRHPLPATGVLVAALMASLLLFRNLLFVWAVAQGWQGPVRLALAADVRLARGVSRCQATPLHAAATRAELEIAALLLERGADPAARDCRGRTPLHRATADATGATTRLLLAHTRTRDSVDEWGRTALLLACEGNNLESAQALLESGADPDLAGGDGQTPLEAAVRNPALLALLLAHRADPDAPGGTSWRRSPLHLAVSLGELDSVRALLAGGVDPAHRDSAGETPLHVAVCSAEPDALEIAKTLVMYGADVSLASRGGWTPLAKGRRQCSRTAVVEWLENAAPPGSAPLAEEPPAGNGGGRGRDR